MKCQFMERNKRVCLLEKKRHSSEILFKSSKHTTLQKVSLSILLINLIALIKYREREKER